MKKLTLLLLIFATLFFPASWNAFADNCSAAFDHSGTCGRNCMSANPGCGLQGCLALCAGTVGAAKITNVAAVNTNPVKANNVAVGQVNAAKVNHGAVNRGNPNWRDANPGNRNRANSTRAGASRTKRR